MDVTGEIETEKITIPLNCTSTYNTNDSSSRKKRHDKINYYLFISARTPHVNVNCLPNRNQLRAQIQIRNENIETFRVQEGVDVLNTCA